MRWPSRRVEIDTGWHSSHLAQQLQVMTLRRQREQTTYMYCSNEAGRDAEVCVMRRCMSLLQQVHCCAAGCFLLCILTVYTPALVKRASTDVRTSTMMEFTCAVVDCWLLKLLWLPHGPCVYWLCQPRWADYFMPVAGRWLPVHGDTSTRWYSRAVAPWYAINVSRSDAAPGCWVSWVSVMRDPIASHWCARCVQVVPAQSASVPCIISRSAGWSKVSYILLL